MRSARRAVNCLTMGGQVRAEWGVSGQNAQGPGQHGAAPPTYKDGERADAWCGLWACPRGAGTGIRASIEKCKNVLTGRASCSTARGCDVS